MHARGIATCDCTQTCMGLPHPSPPPPSPRERPLTALRTMWMLLPTTCSVGHTLSGQLCHTPEETERSDKFTCPVHLSLNAHHIWHHCDSPYHVLCVHTVRYIRSCFITSQWHSFHTFVLWNCHWTCFSVSLSLSLSPLLHSSLLPLCASSLELSWCYSSLLQSLSRLSWQWQSQAAANEIPCMPLHTNDKRRESCNFV